MRACIRTCLCLYANPIKNLDPILQKLFCGRYDIQLNDTYQIGLIFDNQHKRHSAMLCPSHSFQRKLVKMIFALSSNYTL
jgi:hypothetical protein